MTGFPLITNHFPGMSLSATHTHTHTLIELTGAMFALVPARNLPYCILGAARTSRKEKKDEVKREEDKERGEERCFC